MQSTGTPHFMGETVVVIPALNEESCVAATVENWLALGAARVRVVDNGSTDATAASAQRAGGEVLSEPQRGYGAAAWRGVQDWPDGVSWVLFSSADGSDRLLQEEMPAWQAAVDGGAQLIIGDRVSLPASRDQLNCTQRFGNWITCQVIRLGWGQRFKDMGSLRLVRRDSLIQLGIVDRAFGWNVEMQVRAIEQGWNIVELPVRYCPRSSGKSKISGSFTGTLRAGCSIVRMLVWLVQMRRFGPKRAAVQPVSQLPQRRA